MNETFPGAQLWPDAGLARARTRSISTEMATSFANLRMNMSCNAALADAGPAGSGLTTD